MPNILSFRVRGRPDPVSARPAGLSAAAGTGRLHRVSSGSRPVVSALLMTTAVAWSLGPRLSQDEAGLSPPTLSVTRGAESGPSAP